VDNSHLLCISVTALDFYDRRSCLLTGSMTSSMFCILWQSRCCTA